MKQRKFRYFSADFETTVYKGQVNTEVWAAACVELMTEDVKIFHSIGEQLEYFISLDCNVCAYYHNLKFDGSFWLSYLITVLQWKQAYHQLSKDSPDVVEWLREKDMPNKTFKYSISDKGMWYTITLKVNGHVIELRDSLKLLPFSVERIGQSFHTKHKKLHMEYEGFRYAGCEITDKEREYIANDVLVVKEAIEIMFQEGHTDLTIGSCCLKEYKKFYDKEEYDSIFPDLYEFTLDKSQYGYPSAGDYIRKSYRGGWCYVVKGKENKKYHNGITADVNSLYPSMMHSESGNVYPIGKPYFWKGDFIPDKAIGANKYYFVRVRTRFYIKPNKLPFIQIKTTFRYRGTECLETSDILNDKTGTYHKQYVDIDGTVKEAINEMVLTMTDFKLLKDQYDLVDFEILDGCWFYARAGIFDEYINKYKDMKIHSKGARRELAKLFLNNLYGKMASSKDSSFKVAFEKDDGSLGFRLVPEHNKKAGYIPIGSAITSYARNFTIRAAQANYYGVNERGFIYADTDSIHCDLSCEEVKGINVHESAFCCWKLESFWDVAYFTRQKTYIEHVTHEDGEPVEKPYYVIKCAGMPQKCKDLFARSMGVETDNRTLTEEEVNFVSVHRELEDFTEGLKIPGKLMPKRIRGGILLTETDYEMR